MYSANQNITRIQRRIKGMRCVICISSGSLWGIAPDPNMGSRSCARNIAGLSTQKFHLLEPQLVILRTGDHNQTSSDRSWPQWRNAFSGTVYKYILLTLQWRRLYRTQVRFVSALTVISFFVFFCFFCLFVTQISRERLNGFAPNSQRTGCCPVSERLAQQTKRLVFCAVQLLSD